jgi:Domain of unknown function (DUF4440)
MKAIISFIVALGFVSLAIAQEESPSPSSDEKASATVEEAPAATVAPSPKAIAAATSTAEKASSTEKKESTSSEAPKKAAAAPAASKPGKKMSVEATLKDNENRWEAAVASHDPSVSQSMVANDFQGVYWDGKVLSKSSLIGLGKKDKDTYKSAMNEKLSVRSYGSNVSVVVGTAHEKGTGKDGKAFDHVYRFTDTWVDRGGNWQCVASQISKVK